MVLLEQAQYPDVYENSRSQFDSDDEAEGGPRPRVVDGMSGWTTRRRPPRASSDYYSLDSGYKLLGRFGQHLTGRSSKSSHPPCLGGV